MYRGLILNPWNFKVNESGLARAGEVGPAFARQGSNQLKGPIVKQSLVKFFRDESGAAAAEYALILAIVGAGIAIAAKNLGTAISTAINSAQTQI